MRLVTNYLPSVFRQQYSWDQFSTTLEAFQAILDFHQVFAPFLDCVHSFGFRKSEDDEIWSGYRRSISKLPQAHGDFVSYGKVLCHAEDKFPSSSHYIDETTRKEFCYAIRYVARNGRSSGSPWSLRQTAAYQRFDSQSGKSVWILLQPSAEGRRRFEEVQQSNTSTTHPMLLHVVLLFTTVAGWKDYIAYLRQCLDTFVSILPGCLPGCSTEHSSRTKKHAFRVLVASTNTTM